MTTEDLDNYSGGSTEPSLKIEKNNRTHYDIILDNTAIMQIDKYEGYYSAYWKSHKSLKESVKYFYKILTLPQKVTLNIFDSGLRNLKTLQIDGREELEHTLNDNITFLRIDTDGFAVTWHNKESQNRNTLGFISRQNKADWLIDLHSQTSEYKIDASKMKEAIVKQFFEKESNIKEQPCLTEPRFRIDEFIDAIKKAKEKIIIINSFDPTLRELMGAILYSLEKNKTIIEFYLLDPTSTKHLKERNESLSKPGQSTSDPKRVLWGIRDNLELLAKTVARKDVENLENRLKITVYKASPYLAAHCADNYITFGAFPHGELAIDVLQIKTRENSSNIRNFINYEVAQLSERGKRISLRDLENWREVLSYSEEAIEAELQQ